MSWLWMWLRVLFSFPVPAPTSGTLSFARNPQMPTALIATYTPGPDDAGLPIASRTLAVTITPAGATAPNAPIVLDLHGPAPHTFAVDTGDAYHAEDVQVSAGGVKSAPFVLEGIAHDTETAPATPSGVLAFAPAPPAPAPQPTPPAPPAS